MTAAAASNCSCGCCCVTLCLTTWSVAWLVPSSKATVRRLTSLRSGGSSCSPGDLSPTLSKMDKWGGKDENQCATQDAEINKKSHHRNHLRMFCGFLCIRSSVQDADSTPTGCHLFANTVWTCINKGAVPLGFRVSPPQSGKGSQCAARRTKHSHSCGPITCLSRLWFWASSPWKLCFRHLLAIRTHISLCKGLCHSRASRDSIHRPNCWHSKVTLEGTLDADF